MKVLVTATHQCLDHVGSLSSEVFDNVKYVYQLLRFDSFNSDAQCNESTSSANPSTAVNNLK